MALSIRGHFHLSVWLVWMRHIKARASLILSVSHTHTHRIALSEVWWFKTCGGQMKVRPLFALMSSLSHSSERQCLSVSLSAPYALPWAGQSDPLSLQRAAVQSVDLWATFELPFIFHCVPLSLLPRKTHKRSETSKESSCFCVLIMEEVVRSRK